MLTLPGVLFLDSETHSLSLRQWCHASVALPLIYALEQLREGAGTLQVALDGLLQQLALGATLLTLYLDVFAPLDLVVGSSTEESW